MVRTLLWAALLLVAPWAAAEAAPRPAPDALMLAATRPAAHAAYGRRHRVRRFHRRPAVHVPYGRITHPRWPACYDRPPFHCGTPARHRSVIRHRHHRRAVLRARG